MLQALVSSAQQLLGDFRRAFHRPPRRQAISQRNEKSTSIHYATLRRVFLTDGVARTLFEEYSDHRARERGEEETGWVLLGHRDADEAVVLATLPAGTDYDAGVGHVTFNSSGQVIGSRIVRQSDRRLTILGVVHTHPGSLRHPSNGDYRGDSHWVHNLRGKEGLFAIGTADAPTDDGIVASQPKPHVHCLAGLRFSWYALRYDETQYRPLPVQLTIGPDLARPLHALWPALETHGERIDRVYRQQANVTFEVLEHETQPTLVMHVPMAEPDSAVRVLIRNKEVRYLLFRQGELFEVDHHDDLIDRGVYLLLAELAGKD